MSDTIHDLAAPYVLAALDPEETQRFKAHLVSCAPCRADVDALSAGMATLGAAVGGTPPASLERAVMDRLAGTPQELVVVPFRRRTRSWRAVGAIAAAAVLLVGVFAVLTRDTGVDRVLTASDVVSITIPGTEAYSGAPVTASLAYSDAGNAAVATFDGLSATASDLAYQLWIIDAAGPHPAGVFVPDAEGRAVVLLEGVVEAGVTIGLTIEPAGGSESPTGEVLFAVSV